MLSQPIGNLEDADKVVSVPLRTSVADAAALMTANGASAVLVAEDERLAGIFTEHDVVSRVIAPGLDPAQVRVGDVMTRDPMTGDPAMLLGHALLLMHERRIRHLPVVRGGRILGIVCARDALDPELEEFVCEQRRREAYR
jgi:CBS domain-containing protein